LNGQPHSYQHKFGLCFGTEFNSSCILLSDHVMFNSCAGVPHPFLLQAHFTAASSERRKLMSAALSSELRQKHNVSSSTARSSKPAAAQPTPHSC
jgi:hypothetical protein